MGEENKIRDAGDAVRGLLEAVPVYEDALQPAAKEIGTALQTVAKTVHIALAPVSALVWGYEKLKDFVEKTVSEKLSDTPPEEIIPPKVNVAGPALEALRYTGHDETLRELFANLIAASMDVKTTSMAHPSFVEIIKQITPDEAKILRLFQTKRSYPVINLNAGLTGGSGHTVYATNICLLGLLAECEVRSMTSAYIDNLLRLELIERPPIYQYADVSLYQPIENHEEVKALKKRIEDAGRVPTVERGMLRLTQFGLQFLEACAVDHRELRASTNTEPPDEA